MTVVVVFPWVPETADRPGTTHECGQGDLSRYDRQVQLARAAQLRVLDRHGGRHDDRACPIEVRRIMPSMDHDSEGAEVRGTGGIGIAPGDGNSPANGDERQGAHPGPADAHEVDRTRIRGVEQVHDGSS